MVQQAEGAEEEDGGAPLPLLDTPLDQLPRLDVGLLLLLLLCHFFPSLAL